MDSSASIMTNFASSGAELYSNYPISLYISSPRLIFISSDIIDVYSNWFAIINRIRWLSSLALAQAAGDSVRQSPKFREASALFSATIFYENAFVFVGKISTKRQPLPTTRQ